MRHPDLEEARRQLCVLEDILSVSNCGVNGPAMRGLVALLCGMVSRSVADSLCQSLVVTLRRYCLALHSEESEEWARADLSGADYLRLQICKTVNAFDRRLRMLERIRETEPSVLVDLPPAVERQALAPLP